MGGERGATARQRLEGEICCYCKSLLSPPYPGRERPCERCIADKQGVHRVHMRFEKCLNQWRVSFRDLGVSGARFRELTFADSAKIEELVAKTATRKMLEDRQSFESDIRASQGAVTLTLTVEQYRKLMRQHIFSEVVA